jgi:hypothetical protein
MPERTGNTNENMGDVPEDARTAAIDRPLRLLPP